MLKTRRQRSFWARIKLSIILFQTPRRASDLNNFESKSRFFYFRNVDLREKKQCKAIIHHPARPLSLSILCSTLISLPKILLFGFFFFPFPLISKTGLLNCASPWHRSKRKRIYQKTIRFVKYLLSFFIFIFFKFFSYIKTGKIKKYQQRLPSLYRNIKKNNQLLLF